MTTPNRPFRAWCAAHPYWIAAFILGLALLVLAGSVEVLWLIANRPSATGSGAERRGKFGGFLLLAFLAAVASLILSLHRLSRDRK
jgi:ferric-dicitrate binding protein FerR (iron transport regulator)